MILNFGFFYCHCREAELSAQLETEKQKLARAESILTLRVQAEAAVRRGIPPGQAPNVAFANTNRFWVPEGLIFDFTKSLARREIALHSAEGFLGMVVKQPEVGVSYLLSWFE